MPRARDLLHSAVAPVSLVLLAVPGTALAQSTVAAPTREELQRDILNENERVRGRALALDSGIERAPCPLASDEFAGVTFTLDTVTFTGIEAIAPGLLQSSYADFVGQTVSVATVCEIRDRAATTLRRAGYLAAVQIPPQTISSGEVRFDVLLGRMTDVQVRGDAGAADGLLQQYIAKLTADPVFNIEKAERYLLLARDIPGIDVRLALRPVGGEAGGRPGDVVGEFNVTRTPIYVDASVQNLGSEQVGRFGGLVRARFNGLTGLGDETTVSFYSTADFDEQLVAQAGHNFRVGGDGLILGVDGTYAWTRPDLGGAIELESETLVVNGYLTYPVVRSQSVNLFVTAGLEYVDQCTDILNTRVNEDRLSIGYLRADVSLIDEHSVVGRGGYSAFEPRFLAAGSVELRRGFDIFGASEGCGPGFRRCIGQTVVPTRADGDPTAFLVRGEFDLAFRPTPLLAFRLRPRFQVTQDALFSYEEISGGNYTVGRGYDPGAIIGDSGYGLQAEVAYGSLVPPGPRDFAIQPYVFFDAMAVYNKNVAGDPDRIYSAGGGIRATIGRYATLDAVAVAPLKRPPFARRRDSARALITLTMQLAPWN